MSGGDGGLIAFNPDEMTATFRRHGDALDGASVSHPGSPHGVDDDTLAAVAGRSKSTEDKIREAVLKTDAGKAAIRALTENDEDNGDDIERVKDSTPDFDGGRRAGSAGSDSPFGGMPSGGSMPSMPPGMNPGLTAPVYNVPQPLLQELLKGMDEYAATNPDAATGGQLAATGGQPLGGADGVDLTKTGMGKLSDAQVHQVISQALDLNGVPNDPALRAKWDRLLVEMGSRESGFQVDAAARSTSDYNVQISHGKVGADGEPIHTSRGIWQTVPGTFAAHHVGGTSNRIYDPLASCAAAVHYIMSGTAGGDRIGRDGSGIEAFTAKHGIRGIGY